MWNIYPKLQIHVWGGLGSQLYAWALMEKLKIRFPDRRVVLVFHNSGITKRDEELSGFHADESIQVKQDFAGAKMLNNSIRNKLQGLIKRKISNSLKSLGFLGSSNFEQEFLEIKPWVLSVRGHYTGLKISRESVQTILTSIGESNHQNYSDINGPTLGLHFRLGDLLTLESKSPIAMSRLLTGLKMAIGAGQMSNYLIFSDSPHEAMALLYENCPGIDFQIQERDPMQTILDLVNVEVFVGTPSKITEWVTIIRCHKLSQPSAFLPIEMKRQMETIIGSNSMIVYY